MSTGGVFNLIANTGLQDRLLYALEFLNERITQSIINKSPQITEEELNSLPENDYANAHEYILPSLNEIEKSHNTFINSSYKPSIPMASEYIKVANSNPKFGETTIIQFPQIGNFSADSVLHIRLSGLSAKDARDRVRYVAMPGHRLIKHVQFIVNNGGVVDEYGTDDYNAYYQYEVPESKKVGYLRNIGQEIPYVGYITADPINDSHREYKIIGDGNQTLKYEHGAIDLFIPLLFWFKETRSALPSLPWGKLQVKIDFTEVENMVGFFDGGGGGAYNPPKIEFCDLYVNQLFTVPAIFNLFAKKFVFSIFRTHRAHKQIIYTDGSGEYSIKLSNLKWPSEVLYFCFRPRANLELSQYWNSNCKLTEKRYRTPVLAKDVSKTITLNAENNLSTATTFVGAATPGTLSLVDGKYISYDLVITGGTGFDSYTSNSNKYVVTAYDASTKTFTVNRRWETSMPNEFQYFLPDSTTVFELFTPQIAYNNVVYYTEEPVVSSISLTANTIEIFKSNSAAFYNSYLPMKFEDISVPSDKGQYMMPFCTKLGKHDPSGSVNFSLCNELYMNFRSTTISKDYPVDLIVLSRSINFLLVDSSSGGIHVKYSV